MNELGEAFAGFLLGFILSLAMSKAISVSLDTPIAEDITHIQSAITLCNDKGLQPFSTDYNSVTCSNGQVYRLEK